MTRRRKQTSKMSYDSEINVQDYPFYRTIPIEAIRQKQRPLFNETVEYVKAPLLPTPEESYYEERAMPPIESRYQEPCQCNECKSVVVVENLNDTQEEIRGLEDKLQQLHRDIAEQESMIKRNEQIIEQQAKKIETQYGVIEHNTAQINASINSYSHNMSAINYQTHQIQVNNTELSRQQYMDQTLKAQIADTQQQVYDAQAQLTSIQQELESCQQQLAYHQTMLGAFNTLIQNPQYFIQLMSAATNWTPAESTDGV